MRDMPPWKHRRRLVYASWVLGCVMILVGIAAAWSDYGVATQLVVGGVTIITVPLGAYVTFATLDDKWHFPTTQESETDESV